MSSARLFDRHSEHYPLVGKQFGQAAAIYQHQATLQRHSATHLLNIISTYQSSIPFGSALEIGCGTGFITQRLLQMFPQRYLEITDLSTEMLDFCRAHLIISDQQQHLISFCCQDGEKIPNDSKTYAAIISGFVIQWFKNPTQTLQAWFNQLQPGGFLFLSFPTCQSFSEWKQICAQNNLPFTANSLPDQDRVLQCFTPAQIRYQELIQTVDTYPSAAVFFRSLKAIGAGLNQTGTKLSLTQMKRLIQVWDQQTANQVKVSYDIMFLAIQK